jgi:hypothetical protein
MMHLSCCSVLMEQTVFTFPKMRVFMVCSFLQTGEECLWLTFCFSGMKLQSQTLKPSKNTSIISFPFEWFVQHVCFLDDESDFQYKALLLIWYDFITHHNLFGIHESLWTLLFMSSLMKDTKSCVHGILRAYIVKHLIYTYENIWWFIIWF